MGFFFIYGLGALIILKPLSAATMDSLFLSGTFQRRQEIHLEMEAPLMRFDLTSITHLGLLFKPGVIDHLPKFLIL